MGQELEKLNSIIRDSHNIVFFGGAGVSTESGIPDFRSVDGLYNQKYDYPPEPNAAHLKLAEWEQEGKLKAVITQNIDGLHQAAGSNVVLELHGSVLRNYCEDCGRFYDMEYILHTEGVPSCPCGGSIKPDVVLYEEGLNQKTLQDAVRYISEADVLIVGGTSLAVYPAAGLIDYYTGNKLILINKTPTPRDAAADLVVQGSIGEIFSGLS